MKAGGTLDKKLNILMDNYYENIIIQLINDKFHAKVILDFPMNREIFPSIIVNEKLIPLQDYLKITDKETLAGTQSGLLLTFNRNIKYWTKRETDILRTMNIGDTAKVIGNDIIPNTDETGTDHEPDYTILRIE